MSENPTSYRAFARVWTVGHSTRSIEEFVALLAQNSIALLGTCDFCPAPGDIRTLMPTCWRALYASIASATNISRS